MKTITAEKMEQLEASGARVKVKKPLAKVERAPKPEPAPVPIVDNTAHIQAIEEQSRALAMQTEAFHALASSLGEGQLAFAEKLVAMISSNQEGIKPIPYRFTIVRNKRGLVETVDAHPIMD